MNRITLIQEEKSEFVTDQPINEIEVNGKKLLELHEIGTKATAIAKHVRVLVYTFGFVAITLGITFLFIGNYLSQEFDKLAKYNTRTRVLRIGDMVKFSNNYIGTGPDGRRIFTADTAYKVTKVPDSSRFAIVSSDKNLYWFDSAIIPFLDIQSLHRATKRN